MQELPVPWVLQTFFLWVQGMMKYVPENMQIKALHVAKSTICDVLSEVMVATAVPQGLEAGFAQPVVAAPTQLVVQFIDEAEGSGEPQETAVELSHGEILQWTEKPNRSRLQDLDSHTRQESLDKVRKGFTELKSVVNKIGRLPYQLHLHPGKRRDWHKMTKKEHLTACNLEKARSIARADKEYAKLMEEMQQAAAKSPVVRSLFSETPEGTTKPKKEPSSPVQGAQAQEPA